jgi:4-diphosphocytidyl-2-C-methyl-D-erythritol kinase
MVKLLSELAPAKINLFLRVTGRRPDGYHQLDSLFVPVTLYDRIGLGVRPSPTPEVLLRCDTPGLGADDRNLAVRAAHAFMAEFGLAAEVMIDLRKQIPVGSGLGGGSSDAGAVLRMMARLYAINDSARLLDVAVRLGADVPFFLAPAPAQVRGIGEQILPLRDFTPLELVIAVPPINVSTAEIFGLLRPTGWSGPASAESLSALTAGRFGPGVLIRGALIRAALINDLEAVAMARWPAIAELKATLERLGAVGAAMSGSGGAVFGVFPTAAAATDAADAIRQSALAARVFTAATLDHV